MSSAGVMASYYNMYIKTYYIYTFRHGFTLQQTGTRARRNANFIPADEFFAHSGQDV